MTRVTNLSSRKTHSLGREFGCVLAFDGLRVVIFEEDTGCGLWILHGKQNDPVPVNPLVPDLKFHLQKRVLKNSIIRFEQQVHTSGSQKSKINKPCYSKRSNGHVFGYPFHVEASRHNVWASIQQSENTALRRSPANSASIKLKAEKNYLYLTKKTLKIRALKRQPNNILTDYITVFTNYSNT